MTEDHLLLLGKIEGQLNQVLKKEDRLETKFDGVDARLRKVETRSAVLGAGAGTVVSVGIALMIEKGKKTIGL